MEVFWVDEAVESSASSCYCGERKIILQRISRREARASACAPCVRESVYTAAMTRLFLINTNADGNAGDVSGSRNKWSSAVVCSTFCLTACKKLGASLFFVICIPRF